MHTQPTTCRREMIDLFLCDSLSDAEQAAFESHLATCSMCREALSDSAAEPELWDEAADALSDDALEPLECGVSAPLWNDRAEDIERVISNRRDRSTARWITIAERKEDKESKAGLTPRTP